MCVFMHECIYYGYVYVRMRVRMHAFKKILRILLLERIKRVKFALEQAMKAQSGSRGIALLFL